LVGELDAHLAGIPYSSVGLLVGAQMALRLIVVLAAVEGLTSTVDVASIAGLLERLGLHGLGFSMGVALNLLPALQTAALHAWQSLWLRGGLRRKRLRGLRLLMVTILANALGRAEEIALAAEARGYTPERSRRLPIQVGRWDWLVAAVCGLSLLGLLIWQLGG
jgi:energy-coupling factor transporter transmembrane protein EcfT